MRVAVERERVIVIQNIAARRYGISAKQVDFVTGTSMGAEEYISPRQERDLMPHTIGVAYPYFASCTCGIAIADTASEYIKVSRPFLSSGEYKVSWCIFRPVPCGTPRFQDP